MNRRRPSRADKVLVAGGGVAALETALALRELAQGRVEVELLAPGYEFVYRPLAVAEPFHTGSIHRFDLAGLTQAAGARHRLGSLTAVYPKKHLARTTKNDLLEYDALVLALGARPEEAVPGAITFSGRESVPAVQQLIEDLVQDAAAEVVFVVPSSKGWPLPLYELALLTATYLAERGLSAKLTLVTPEAAPLAIFGDEASDIMASLLREHKISIRTETYPRDFDGDVLRVVPGPPISAERALAMPRLVGPAVPGIPHDDGGFIPVDEHGQVQGLDDVYAAGDATTFPIKQGGLATQQADAVAEHIAAAVGAPVDPKPFRPILRGLVLTGGTPEFLRAEIFRSGRRTSTAEPDALWWPPGKIAGRYLGPFLAERAEFAYSY
ncbi:MAG: FAD/NAD(P)-binding oxidoreductase [Dehalococcoidia bacterium]